MNVKNEKEKFELEHTEFDSAKLSFLGVDGFDVYNCSQPFNYQGKVYIYGRVEKRDEWARSLVRLFESTGTDEFTLVPNSMMYQLEDPYVSFVDNELVLGGTHVRKIQDFATYNGYFYRGTDLEDLTYFTTGPEYMKDIRVVQLASGKLGVFSRPRNEEIKKKFGSESMVGFTVIENLDELTDKVIEEAPYLEDLFSDGEWGGVNQGYLLENGKIGVLGHVSYSDNGQQVYCNMSFVFDPDTRKISDYKLIGTRASYPAGPSKKEFLNSVAFTSGLSVRKDGKVNLYSGIGDTEEGRTVIEYPFENEGKIVMDYYYID